MVRTCYLIVICLFNVALLINGQYDMCVFSIGHSCTLSEDKYEYIYVTNYLVRKIYVICSGFSKFSEARLDIECTESVFYFSYFSALARLVPAKELLLDNTFITNTNTTSINKKFYLYHLKGIDLYFDYSFEQHVVLIDYSKLDFYFKGELIDKTRCEELWQMNSFEFRFFQMHSIDFGRNVRYSKQQCPYMYHQSSRCTTS